MKIKWFFLNISLYSTTSWTIGLIFKNSEKRKKRRNFLTPTHLMGFPLPEKLEGVES
jgi:hypothetical protein